MSDELTGPIWDAIRAAGIEITKNADGWRYATKAEKAIQLTGGGYASAEEALTEVLTLLVNRRRG